MDGLIFKLPVSWTGPKKFLVIFAIWTGDRQKLCEKSALRFTIITPTSYAAQIDFVSTNSWNLIPSSPHPTCHNPVCTSINPRGTAPPSETIPRRTVVQIASTVYDAAGHEQFHEEPSSSSHAEHSTAHDESTQKRACRRRRIPPRTVVFNYSQILN